MTKRIEFLRTELYESEGRNKGPTFPEGSVWDVTDEFGHRWVTMRGVAVELDEKPGKLKGDDRFVFVRQSEADLEASTADEAPAPVPPPHAAPVDPPAQHDLLKA